MFERWLKQACEAKLTDPTACIVATVDETGQPYQRIVLLKACFDKDGLIFYTNMGSRKAWHLAKNPKISVHFPWYSHGQTSLFPRRGGALIHTGSGKIFPQPAEDSQIAAWASQQSSRISRARYSGRQIS